MSELKKQDTKNLFATPQVKQKFDELLGKRAPQFMTSVLQVVSSNHLLKDADPMSVYMAAVVAATLDLPLNNNLGFAYIVPYNARQSDGSYKSVAQFQMGYKGFIQIALRSGQYKSIDSCPVFEGQLVTENPLSGHVFDWSKKDSSKVIGYVAQFELLNGFTKQLYMSIEELEQHGAKYSKTYKKGLWQSDFSKMAEKTVLKQLISKYGPMSIERDMAVAADQAVIKDADTMDVSYIDNEPIEIDHELVRFKGIISECTTIDQLEAVYAEYGDTLRDVEIEAYNQKHEELSNG